MYVCIDGMTTSMYCLYVRVDYTYIDVNALAQGIKSFLASHVCMYVCIDVLMYDYMYVCMCMYVYVCIKILSNVYVHPLQYFYTCTIPNHSVFVSQAVGIFLHIFNGDWRWVVRVCERVPKYCEGFVSVYPSTVKGCWDCHCVDKPDVPACGSGGSGNQRWTGCLH